VGISNLQNLSLSLVLKFHKFKDGEEARPAYWIPYHYLCSSEDNIYNIDDYTNYTDIDFNTSVGSKYII
jgi:hypothetical protein